MDGATALFLSSELLKDLGDISYGFLNVFGKIKKVRTGETEEKVKQRPF